MIRGGIVLVVILAAFGGLYLIKSNNPEPAAPSPSPAIAVPPTQPFDFGNQTFTLDDQTLIFRSGTYTSSSQEIGTHTADIKNQTTNPSANRAAAIVVDNPGGSGTFYYLVGGMLIDGKEIYSKPILLGDRIIIQSITVEDPMEHDNGEIIVRYLDRRPADPMSASPTKEMKKLYSFEDSGELIEALN